VGSAGLAVDPSGQVFLSGYNSSAFQFEVVRYLPSSSGTGLDLVCAVRSATTTPDFMCAPAVGKVYLPYQGIYTVYEDCPGGGSAPASLARLKPTEEAGGDGRKALGGKPLVVAPNPSKGAATALFRTEEEGQVTLQVFNLAMDRVRSFELGTVPAGEHQRTFQVDGLASGVYLVQVQFKGPGGIRSLGLFKWALVK